MHLAELKAKSPSDLLSYAESLQIENASSQRKQDMMFAILKNRAENDQAIHGEGTLEIPIRSERAERHAAGRGLAKSRPTTCHKNVLPSQSTEPAMVAPARQKTTRRRRLPSTAWRMQSALGRRVRMPR